jgi:hypothetical protein
MQHLEHHHVRHVAPVHTLLLDHHHVEVNVLLVHICFQEQKVVMIVMPEVSVH